MGSHHSSTDMADLKRCLVLLVISICVAHGTADAIRQTTTQTEPGDRSDGVHSDVLNSVLDRLKTLEEKNAILENTASSGSTTDGVGLDACSGALTRLKALEEKNAILERTVAEQQDVLAELRSKREFALLDHTSESQKRFVMAPNLPIAFTTRLTPTVLDHVNPGDVITFGDVLTNHGGGLNANSSVFTAPMGGIYILSCSLMDSQARGDGSGVMLHADIVKNGNVVLGRMFAHAEGASYRDQGAQTVIVELQKGDRVWIRNWNSRDLGVGGELYSTFSGYLLWPLE